MSYAQFELVGGLAGKTVNLGGHDFIEGVFTFGPSSENVLPSTEEVALKANYLAKSYQAYLVGSPELEAAKVRLAGGETPPGELDVGKREDQEQEQRDEEQVSSRQRLGAIRTAIGKLSPDNDDHWTNQGLPSVEAVRELSGSKEVSRGDITALAPNLTREEAKRLADGGSTQDPLDS